MKQLLLDTTIWIDYLNGKMNGFTSCLHDYLINDYSLCITPTVIQELLQGIKKDSQYPVIKNLVVEIDILKMDVIDAAMGASVFYRSIRKKGVTFKSTVCLIAQYAIRFKVEMVHRDKDFDAIARYTKLKNWLP